MDKVRALLLSKPSAAQAAESKHCRRTVQRNAAPHAGVPSAASGFAVVAVEFGPKHSLWLWVRNESYSNTQSGMTGILTAPYVCQIRFGRELSYAGAK